MSEKSPKKKLYKAVGTPVAHVDRPAVELVEKFESMKLREEVLRGIYTCGFTEPFLIQQRAILPCINTKNDAIIQAHPGAGKTVALSILVLQETDTDLQECQVLILSPNHDSAYQIRKVIIVLGIHTNVKCSLFTDDTNLNDDITQLEQGAPHVIVGTPGRIFDLLSRNAFITGNIQLFVLDGADEMLFPRFKYPIYNVLMRLPHEVRVILVSDTMSAESMEESLCLMKNPTQFLVEKKEFPVENIKQYYITVQREVCKFSTLLDLPNVASFPKAIVYCNTREKVDWLTVNLRRQKFDYTITAIYGDMDEKQRDYEMHMFKCRPKEVVVCTDFVCDTNFQLVPLVVNYDLPLNCENYIRRMQPNVKRYCANPRGVISLVTAEEKKTLKDFGKLYNMRIEEMPSSVNLNPNSLWLKEKK